MTWEVDGILGNADPPSQIGTAGGPLLIMGGGRCLWDDLRRINDPKWGWERMGINDVIKDYQGNMRHAVSLHGEHLGNWLALRQNHGWGEGKRPMVHTYKHFPNLGADALWAGLECLGGTSGLFAALIAICLGYTQIVLAGLPQDGTGRYFDPPVDLYDSYCVKYDEDQSTYACWHTARTQYFKGRVRSLSGNTRGWLGEPTKEWLEWELK